MIEMMMMINTIVPINRFPTILMVQLNKDAWVGSAVLCGRLHSPLKKT